MANVPKISPAEAEELGRLYGEWSEATSQAFRALRGYGMNSSEFLEADRRAGEIWHRIRAIGGLAGKHWMS